MLAAGAFIFALTPVFIRRMLLSAEPLNSEHASSLECAYRRLRNRRVWIIFGLLSTTVILHSALAVVMATADPVMPMRFLYLSGFAVTATLFVAFVISEVVHRKKISSAKS